MSRRCKSTAPTASTAWTGAAAAAPSAAAADGVRRSPGCSLACTSSARQMQQRAASLVCAPTSVTHRHASHPRRRVVREQRGARWTPEQQAAALHGTGQLYLALKGELDAQLQKFEAYALETCLHVPAGLLAAPVRGWAGLAGRRRSAGAAAGLFAALLSLIAAPQYVPPLCRALVLLYAADCSCHTGRVCSPPAQAAAGDGEAAVDEAEEAAADEQLAQLRQQIAAAKHQGGCWTWAARRWWNAGARPACAAAVGLARARVHAPAPHLFCLPIPTACVPAGRQLRAGIAQYDAALERYSSSVAGLQVGAAWCFGSGWPSGAGGCVLRAGWRWQQSSQRAGCLLLCLPPAGAAPGWHPTHCRNPLTHCAPCRHATTRPAGRARRPGGQGECCGGGWAGAGSRGPRTGGELPPAGGAAAPEGGGRAGRRRRRGKGRCVMAGACRGPWRVCVSLSHQAACAGPERQVLTAASHPCAVLQSWLRRRRSCGGRRR